MSLFGVVDSIATLSREGLSWYSEANRTRLADRSLTAEETVRLAALGFTTGRARVAPGAAELFQSTGYAPSGGSGGLNLGGLAGYVPLVIGAFLLLKLLK